MIEQRGETLIHVPCWWSGDEESLVATIKRQRPELLSEHSIISEPISLVPPPGFFKTGSIPEVGELMLASFPPVGFSATVSIESPWWLGEKYDGIRCCWNPNIQKLFTRTALEIVLPDVIAKNIGDTFIDGEIWCGRGEFLAAQQFTHSSTLPGGIPFFRITAFDDPELAKHEMEFEDRYKSLVNSISPTQPIVISAN